MFQLIDNGVYVSPATPDFNLITALAFYVPDAVVTEVIEAQPFLDYDSDYNGDLAPARAYLSSAWIVCRLGLSTANSVSRLKNTLTEEREKIAEENRARFSSFVDACLEGDALDFESDE